MFELRTETPGDVEAIASLNTAAFGQADEAKLIARLREGGHIVASLVAIEDGDVVGHILFSHLPIHTEAGVLPAAALAPMAVHPSRQRQGIGGKLIEAGLEACRDKGIRAVVVLGHPDYYPRFGFSADQARRLRSPYSDAGDAFMAKELVPGALDDVDGEVIYPRPFGELE